MEQLPYDEMVIAYDDDSQNYYCIWRPLTSVGLGKTEAEALDDLRAAAHLGIETTIDLKLRKIEKNSYRRWECGGWNSIRRSNLGPG
jgi:predicted RNase H-like HicB family nuclease